MRDAFGVIRIVIQNLPIAQGDIKYDKKVENITFDAGEARCQDNCSWLTR